ncbi:hypothetical protein [Defluviimonas salinarum]|uniref:Uncharacterized protein n=1 Tax=Defluviimonas salinarum TaxID=2992147 RepID=A0ABT3J7A1_9RHOB|nr:hypothetical protein [Defluviimonas salinarum]MCW3783562.1 hypothetical protein [Defluviimonas salinarum]
MSTLLSALIIFAPTGIAGLLILRSNCKRRAATSPGDRARRFDEDLHLDIATDPSAIRRGVPSADRAFPNADAASGNARTRPASSGSRRAEPALTRPHHSGRTAAMDDADLTTVIAGSSGISHSASGGGCSSSADGGFDGGSSCD